MMPQADAPTDNSTRPDSSVQADKAQAIPPMLQALNALLDAQLAVDRAMYAVDKAEKALRGHDGR